MKTKELFFIILLLTIVVILNSSAQDNTKAGLPEGAIARLGKGGINLMRFSPDGTHLAVGTDVGVWLYDVPDGKETALFTEHTGQVNALAFSTDGKILASGGFNNPIIQLWDLETESKLSNFTLLKRQGSVSALTFNKDNTKLIVMDTYRDITHWEVSTGRKLADIDTEHSYETVTFSQDGSTFATGDEAGKIRLWDATTALQQATLAGHSSLFTGDNFFAGFITEIFKLPEDPDIWSLAFSPDGKMLASGSLDETVQLWNTERRSKRGTLKGHKSWVTAVAFSPDSKIVASGDVNKVIKLWNVNTRRERATLTGHTNGISAVTFSPDGKTLASGSYDGTIRFWNAKTGQEMSTFATGYVKSVKTVAFSENGTTLASAAFNGTVEIWSLTTGLELTTFTAGQSNIANAVALSSDATHFASQGSKGRIAFDPFSFGSRGGGREGHNSIQLWDLNTGAEILGPWRVDRTTALAFSPDNKILACSGLKEIRAWDIKTGVEMFHFNTERHPFGRQLMFSSNGTLFAVNARHRGTRIWDITTQREITPPNINDVRTSTLSPDGALLATANREGIYLWQLDTAADEPKVIHGNLQGLRNLLTFSPDGTILIGSGMEGWDILIKLWDVETGNQLATLTGHTENITILVFSHDGKTLASGSQDGTVLLWDWDKITNKAAEDNK